MIVPGMQYHERASPGKTDNASSDDWSKRAFCGCGFHFETLTGDLQISVFTKHRNKQKRGFQNASPFRNHEWHPPVRQRLSFTFFTNATRPSCGAVAPGMGIAPLPPASGQLRQQAVNYANKRSTTPAESMAVFPSAHSERLSRLLQACSITGAEAG